MPGVGVLLFVAVGVAQSWAQQYLNNRPFPTYSLENMPETTFSCRDKILGGYYADPDTQCQMFHICVKVAGVGVQDFRFLCPNGTAFDQDHQICAEWEDVDCDASTLYYSSDNFDLYRIGSGLESKSVKYGEDEETFALQRAETGDARLNREPQSGIVNQKKEQKFNYQRPKPAQNNDREIFKASSSSNFFNNRNNGKERDEDYDDNVNLNQDRDNEQRRKVVRNRGRKPSIQTEYNRNEQNRNVQANNRQATQNEDHNQNRNNDHNRNNNYNNQNNNYRNQNADYNRQSQTADFTRNTPAPPADYSRTSQQSQTSSFNQNTADYTPRQQSQAQTNTYKQNTANTANAAAAEIEAQTRKPSSRPTGFLNNFAGSSYVPTTLRPLAASTTINSDQYTTAINNYRARNGQKPRPQQTNDYTAQTPQYTVSTPAPFKSTQYRQISTFAPTKDTDNYPKTKPSTTERYNQQATNFKQNANPNDYKYELTKTKPSTTYPGTKTENYPSNNPQYFDKKPTTPVKQTETFPTTLSTKPKPFSANTQTFPTTFAPRTNAAYTQIAQQTLKQQSSTLIATGFVQTKASTTSKAVTSTPYTPTVPKISPTTPIARSSRFDETQYDDGSYNSGKYDKYDYDADRRDDEFLKGAHSQNIAASRNEFAKTTKYQQQTTKKYYQQQPTQKPSYETPRPFSVTANTPKGSTSPQRPTNNASPTPKQVTNQNTQSPKQNTNHSAPPQKPEVSSKKAKDYDYAYYDTDTNSGSEPEYEITEIKKSTVKN